MLYVRQSGEYLLVTIIYMDDLIILANNVTQLKWLKSELEKNLRWAILESCMIAYIQNLRGIENLYPHHELMELHRGARQTF